MNHTPDPSASTTARLAWLLWAAMVTGILLLAVFIAWIADMPEPADRQAVSLSLLLGHIALAAACLVLPAAFLLRARLTRPAPAADRPVVTPRRFLTAHIIAWVLCEAPAHLSLVAVLVGRSLFPQALAALLCLAGLLYLRPTCSVMFEQSEPDVDDPDAWMHQGPAPLP